jgi:DNA-binding SARP family transcriptional activator
MLRVRLAGGLRLALDGREIAPPPSRRARALLAWLALRPGNHPRGELAGRFWPEVLEESARTSLRAALTELRRALGEGAATLVATRETVALADDGVWVDVREFERMLAAGRLEEAVDACAGELLTDMDDEWVHDARAAHRAALADALERLAEAAEQAGDLATAVRRTRAAFALDPLAEEAGRRLIRRLAAGGDGGAAIAVYEQLAERLRAELAIAPSTATRALVQEIRRGGGERAAPLPDVPPPATLARADETPFVGREAELERIGATWRGVVASRTRRLVLLAGEPGIGKTRLALQLAKAAQRQHAVVLLGRCSEEPLSAYEPFAEVLRHCAAALGAEALTSLAGVGASELGRFLGAAEPEAAGDVGARRRLFGAIDAVLHGVAGDRPLLLLLDDLQWADRDTLALLGAVLRSPQRSPTLLVGTCRSTDIGPRSPLTRALADLQRDRMVERIDLHGLAPADVASLAESWLGEDDAARMADAVHARTGGNAFFVVEILRGLSQPGARGVPQNVRQAINARRAGLGDDADLLLAVAAVLGLEVDLGLLEAVAELPAERAETALDELIAADLLRPAQGSARGVEFPHALVREAVDAELNALRRRRLHRRAADALIAVSEDRHLEEIAHHLSEAASPADTDHVVDYLRRAGERAVAMLAYDEASRFLARALEALEAHGVPDDPRAGALQIARGDALLRAGAPGEARACFAAAAALARRTRDSELLAHAALGSAGLGVALIDVDPERVELLEEALAAVGDRHPLLSSQLLARLAVELYYTPARDRSEALSAEAVAAARSVGDGRAVASALNARHVALWRPDRVDERLQTANQMLRAAQAAGERHLELQARNWRVVDLFELGDLDAWREEARRHGALAKELRLPLYEWYTPLWAAVDALHAGRFTEAERLREQAHQAGETAGDPNATLFAQLLRIQEGFLRADYRRIDLDIFREKIADSPAGISWRCGYTWCLAALGRADEARAHLAAIAADGYAALPFDANWPSAAGECAEACIVLGDAHHAAPLYELLAPYAGRHLAAGRAIVTYGAADRHLGGLATVLGRTEEAIAHHEQAIRLNAAAGLRPWVVHARMGLATALRAGGEPDGARHVETTAVAEAHDLEIIGLLGR